MIFLLTGITFLISEFVHVESDWSHISKKIAELLKDYDVRLRPNFGGAPLLVGMDVIIGTFDSISEANMDYTLTMYLNQYWRDERLAFGKETDVLALPGDFSEKIWVPDTFLANDKKSYIHDITERNKMIRLHGNGLIEYGMRFTTTLACLMDLHYYPLDVQNCTVEIESYGYTVGDVVMFWRDTPVFGVEEAELPQFTIVGYNANDRKERLATGEYQRLSLSFKLERNIGYFVFQTYLPSILIVMLSWVSFWINHEATSARVALGITTVLTMTTISTGVRSALPRISYVKAIDIYLVMCFVFVFAALLEYAAVNYTYWGGRAKKAKKRDIREAADGCQTQDCKELPKDLGIIELHELAMSPIASLRHRQGKSYKDPPIALPSFRIHRPCNPVRSKSSNLLNNIPKSNQRFLQSLKRTPLKISFPRVKDVNIIDKYSRLVFPISFLLFNVTYWCYYIL
ncbi:gamma-aminobutyric acid receptor subunit beta-like isoform X1 [Artemia franciscana]|uniref:Gamma-aminobutyric acid receptor subunit beta n=2 Tax=Artemia franciscana TaxID=6661 RepID=A0AA88ILC4_ARTSF|nr:hypothetical protein QYM36_000400 [Artemia franciscana]